MPGYPMDGGRILRALLTMRMATERATQIAARLGQGVAVIFGLVSLFVSPLLTVIGVFLWLGVQQARRTELETASPSDALDRALTRMHQGE